VVRIAAFASFIWFVFASTVFAQHRLDFELGFRAGVPFIGSLKSDSFSNGPGFSFQETFDKPGYTVGPTFGAVLYDRLLVQFDALYKPIHGIANDITPTVRMTRTSRAGSWEFPLLFDYRFLHRMVRPFAGGGGVIGQTITGTTDLAGLYANVLTPIPVGFYANASQHPAPVANAGIEWSRSTVVIRPELRYTRWRKSFVSPRRNPDQFEFLIGFSLRPR
jgi:hypothetical protein